MKNKFEEVFETQKKFQKKLFDKDFSDLSYEEKVKITKDFILSAHKELSETLDCLHWKAHRKEDKFFTSSNLGEEIIDAFKFIVNICLVWGIDAEKFLQIFNDKTLVVEQRYKQEFLGAEKNEKVCAIDLDDVLNEWEDYYVKVYNKKHKTKFKDDKEIRKNTDPLEYAAHKHWWRDSGIKLKIPAKKGASDLTKYLHKKGYKIVIISSRPYERYFRLFSDTINWLKNNNIVYDEIYFNENKHLTILKHFPKLSFMIEDNQLYAEQVAAQGYLVFQFHKERTSKNLSDLVKEKIIHVYSLKEIKDYV